MMMQKLGFFTGLVFLWWLTAAGKDPVAANAAGTLQPQDGYQLVLQFKPMAGDTPLLLGETYTNCRNEAFTVNIFRFYISHIQLIQNGTGLAIPAGKDSCYLVDATNDPSCNIRLTGMPLTCDSICFMIGVDSIYNASGAQTGTLDPVNGMFWTWNSGYVMAKLEGQSPMSALVNHKMEYHIGGYKGAAAVQRNPRLGFPAGRLGLAAGKETTMIITADVNAWFCGPHSFTISSQPACTTPGPVAAGIADNYSRMFAIKTITQ
jgi:hypothetical protein